MGPTVAVLGGGVAGMTAAHELAERGFTVTIYEQRSILGGKARSYEVAPDGSEALAGLPAEHGFRFFPGFYQHIPHTMRRIPHRGAMVAERLRPADRACFARIDPLADIVMPTRFPVDVDSFIVVFRALRADVGLSWDEARFFVKRLGAIAKSCDARRIGQIEQKSWTFWVEGDDPTKSPAYRMFCAEGLMRLLVAARSDKISARTAGSTLQQLLFDLAPFGDGADRVLDGPTQEAWIDPWRDLLLSLGVTIETGVKIVGVDVTADGVQAVRITSESGSRTVTADYVVLALPSEVVARDIVADNPALLAGLGGVARLEREWMNGVQFYLRRSPDMVAGHTAYMQSPWSLTSICQGMVWEGGTGRFGNGDVKDILSVDISNWAEPDWHGRRADSSDPEALIAAVLEQINAHIGPRDHIDRATDVIGWSIDQSLRWNGAGWTNEDPLLVNVAGTLQHRPGATIPGIRNLFVAGDYVRTNTDLATMEAANESGRRAANGVLRADGRPEDVWVGHLAELGFLAGHRERDRANYAGSPDRLPWERPRHLVGEDTQWEADQDAFMPPADEP